MVDFKRFYQVDKQLTDRDVHLWFARLDEEPKIAHLKSILADDERSRGERFIFKQHRIRFFIAHIFLRQVLSWYTDISPSDLQFSFYGHGKPKLTHDDIHFNMSHSGDFVVVGVRQNGSIGVDIEQYKPRDFLGISTYSFSNKEIDSLQSLRGLALEQTFYEIWAKKEAYIKYTGLGLKEDLKAFSVALGEGFKQVSHTTTTDGPTIFYSSKIPHYAFAVCSDKCSKLTFIDSSLSDFST